MGSTQAEAEGVEHFSQIISSTPSGRRLGVDRHGPRAESLPVFGHGICPKDDEARASAVIKHGLAEDAKAPRGFPEDLGKLEVVTSVYA